MKALEIHKSFALGEAIDLSAELSIQGQTTLYTWKTKGGEVLQAGEVYEISNGRTIFKSIPSDSVYCEMTNAAYPDFSDALTFRTSCTQIQVSTGTAVVDQKAVRVYGQRGGIYIRVPEPKTVIVYDVTGQLVHRSEVVEQTLQLPVTRTGFYLVVLRDEHQEQVHKVVVK